MIEDMKQALHLIALGKFAPDHKNFEKYEFQRGWNAGLEFAEQQIKKQEKAA